MSSLKCAQCGLVNFLTDRFCKRCGASLGSNATSVVAPPQQGIVLEDGYVLPPPPITGMPGVWRDDSKLVMSKEALLPDRCVRCNVPTTGRLKRTLTWHHPAIYLIILVALLIYVIVAMVLRKTARIEIGLCDEHRAKRKRNVLITWALCGVGLMGMVLAIAMNDGTYFGFGFLALFAALIFGLFAVRVVTPAKIDDRFVWLRGVNKEYLDELPQWAGY
ncbi:MAG TPA: hypothetical protein VJU86_18380 [Pyrinomonadaceae bacterium]|nr:hypothetical protein [Pyrinomonadaceae bacterium]